ncbi:asparagine synthase (glutamine-hydrolyzing) [Nocardia thailandica]|uniref:asparagine synthase (glutamine-hydrolyzing) n=1 Tax=Nocardia thailandica TaxID=257275 RepID=UPI0002ED32E1|nr:asparagine synthase (glutamine-hydrolyzing) [Nocardia thailandica]
MSGLIAWVDERDDLRGEQPIAEAMLDRLRHRGTASTGLWINRRAALGYRGHAPAQAQPFVAHTEVGDVVAVVAGHITNPAELEKVTADAGVAAPSATVAELVLHAYLCCGEDFVDHVDGEFAIAIRDERSDLLLLVRDRLGVKPLYYHRYPTGIMAASEPKGMIANPRFSAQLDRRKLPILLQPRLSLPGETPFLDMFEVPPGAVVRYAESGLSVRHYWRLHSHPHTDDAPTTAARVRELLESAVRSRAETSGQLAAMLSGGLDSTSVAALASRTIGPNARLDTYCIQFDSDATGFVASELRPDLDAPFAAEAARYLGTCHRPVTATTADLMAAIPATRRARDLPGWGQFDASMYVLFERMAAGAAVALTGEAADEIFGGYPYFFRPETTGRGGFPWLFDGPTLADCLADDVREVVDPAADLRDRYDQLVAAVPRLDGESASDARMREMFYLSMAGPLSVILDRKERMSMAHGLEVRVPFCDHRLVQYVWNVPWSVKSAGGVKGLLKTAMADVVPPSTLNRRKSAYPHVRSAAYDESVIAQAERALAPGSPVATLFDRSRTTRLIERIAAGAVLGELPGGSNPAALLIQLVELQHWIEDYEVGVA